MNLQTFCTVFRRKLVLPILSLWMIALPGVQAAKAAPAVLYSLTGGSDGAFPHAGLLAASDGSLFGTTSNGGSAADFEGNGTVFKLTTGGVWTTLYTFPSTGAKGVEPSGLVLANDGNLYGTTASGGTGGAGTIFRLTPAGTLTSLWSFTGGSDGEAPNGLVAASDGNFYGTTGSAGANGYGTIFKVTTGGALTTLYTFTGGSDGASPQAALIQAADGNLYGTTCYGGSGNGYAGFGTLFVVTTGGALSTLHTFTGSADGAYAYGTLAQSTSGDLYGTTSSSATGANRGTVFKLTASGVFTTLHAFTGGSDGDGPTSGLVEAADGSLYGTTHTAGTDGSGNPADGTLFSVTTDGVFTTLATFAAGSTAAFTPYAALAAGSDGKLYGTTVNGGTNNQGAIFQQQVAAAATSHGTLQFGAATFTASETAGTATITVTRAGGSAGAISVAWAATVVTAVAGVDFTAASGTLSWADGDATSKTFTVAVMPNTASSANHTVNLALSASTGGATLGSIVAASLILTDSSVTTVLPTVNILVRGDGYLINCGEKGKLLITRTNGDTSGPLTVHYKIKGTANNGTDYVGTDGVALDGSVVIPAGETQVKLKVKALTTPASNTTVKIVLEADSSGLYLLGTQTKAKLLLINPSIFQF